MMDLPNQTVLVFTRRTTRELDAQGFQRAA